MLTYYHSCRTHLSLEKDAPGPRLVESPAMGRVTAVPKVGGATDIDTGNERSIAVAVGGNDSVRAISSIGFRVRHLLELGESLGSDVFGIDRDERFASTCGNDPSAEPSQNLDKEVAAHRRVFEHDDPFSDETARREKIEITS